MKKMRVAVFYGYEQPWENVNLIKDCGLIPFLLHKNHGMDVSLIGTRADVNYTFMKCVPGMTLVPLPAYDAETKASYAAQHAAEIDMVMIFGSYYDSMLVAERYKSINPGGFVFLNMDLNEDWMKRIPYEKPLYSDFYARCDLIGVAVPSFQTYLDTHTSLRTHVIRNGYYHFDKNQEHSRPFEQKENTILTVSRLGSEQKRTDVLLLAFARISLFLSDWKLRLVGTIEPSFQPFIDALFEEMPDLKNRIEFTGMIEDRAALHEEYLRARIVAMTSYFEGGTNVFGEALTAGCVIASTDLASARDAVGEDMQCGLVSPVNDHEAFSDILLSLCTNVNLKKMSESAVERGMKYFQMESIVADIYKRTGIATL